MIRSSGASRNAVRPPVVGARTARASCDRPRVRVGHDDVDFDPTLWVDDMELTAVSGGVSSAVLADVEVGFGEFGRERGERGGSEGDYDVNVVCESCLTIRDAGVRAGDRVRQLQPFKHVEEEAQELGLIHAAASGSLPASPPRRPNLGAANAPRPRAAPGVAPHSVGDGQAFGRRLAPVDLRHLVVDHFDLSRVKRHQGSDYTGRRDWRGYCRASPPTSSRAYRWRRAAGTS